MDENVVLNIRSTVKKMLITAAIFAICAGIGTLITSGLITKSEFKSTEGATACAIFFVAFLDIVRISGFGMFVASLVLGIVELWGKAPKKMYSYVILAGSIFGFIGALILSYSNLITSIMNATAGAYYNSNQAINNAMTSTIVAGCVFMFVSAVAVIGTIMARDYAGAYNNGMYGAAAMTYGNNAPAAGAWICSRCGAVNDAYSMNCRNCGNSK